MANYVISGGPATGKTSVIEELRKLGYGILEEPARELFKSDERFKGKSIKEINQQDFQDTIFKHQKNQFDNLPEGAVFCDRGIGDTLAYRKMCGLNIPEELLDFAKKVRHDKVFIFDFLDFYEQDELRQETKEEQEKIHQAIIDAYNELGYEPVFVPFMSIQDRVKFILEKIKV